MCTTSYLNICHRQICERLYYNTEENSVNPLFYKYFRINRFGFGIRKKPQADVEKACNGKRDVVKENSMQLE